MALGDRAFEGRSNIIGGSEVAAVLGQNKWITPAGLMAVKLSGVQEEVSPEHQRILNVGKAMEETVLQFFEQVNPHRHFTTGHREPQYGIKNSRGDEVIIISHPDVMRFETDTTEGRHTVRLLELKTTTGWRDDIGDRSVPPEYEVQLQMEMHGAQQDGTNAEVADLAIYNLSNGKLHLHQSVYEREFCENAVELCTEFHDLLTSDKSRVDIIRAVAGPMDNIVELLQIAAGEETMEIGENEEQVEDVSKKIARLSAAKKGVDSWGQEFAAAKNDIANFMGDKRFLEVFGERLVSYGNTKPPARNAKPIRQMQNEWADPNNITQVAKMMIPKLADLEGLTEGRIMDALEPAIVTVGKRIAQKAINDNIGQASRLFRPNYNKVEKFLEEAREEQGHIR